VRCLECDEDVCVGTAGPAGIVQHQGKKPCKKARANEEKGKLRTLFAAEVRKVKAMLPGTASASSENSWSQTEQSDGAQGVQAVIAELKTAAELNCRVLQIHLASRLVDRMYLCIIDMFVFLFCKIALTDTYTKIQV